MNDIGKSSIEFSEPEKNKQSTLKVRNNVGNKTTVTKKYNWRNGSNNNKNTVASFYFIKADNNTIKSLTIKVTAIGDISFSTGIENSVMKSQR